MTTYFAPLEGITGHIFRSAHAELFKQPDVYYSPFLSPTQNRVLTPREKKEILPENNEGLRLVPQLMTNKAEDFLWAAGELAAMGYDEVNLNLGCPSGTVVAKKKGSGFLSMPGELDAFFSQVFEKVQIRVSVKTRLGKNNPEEFCRLLEIYNKYPICLLTVHPRVQADFYKNTPNEAMFAQALLGSRNPVCYNGNIFIRKDYERFREKFPACSHLMMGRGFVANPALLESFEGKGRSRERLMQFHQRLYDAYREELSGERNVLFKMKELWNYFIRTFGDGNMERARLEKRLKKAVSLSQYEETVRDIFSELELLEEYDLGF